MFKLPIFRRSPAGSRKTRRFTARPTLESLEQRLTLNGNLSFTNLGLVSSDGSSRLTGAQPVGVGQPVTIEANWQTKGLPTAASYEIRFSLNGEVEYSDLVTAGAGVTGSSSYYWYLGGFIAAPGTNTATVTFVNAAHSPLPGSVPVSTPFTFTAGPSRSFTFTAASSAVEGGVPYTVSQIRDAYDVNSIPNIGSVVADGSGQTVAIIDGFNDPNVLSDLDGFDKGMYLSTSSTQSLYQQYGSASSLLNVYNEHGTNITKYINDSLSQNDNGVVETSEGVPALASINDGGDGEIMADVEWVHAMAPGARIDLIETDSMNDSDILAGVTTASNAKELPGVSVVSMSVVLDSDTGVEWPGETAVDQDFTTPSGQSGITFVVASGDGGAGDTYPASSPNVLAVGGTQLNMNGDSYGGEVPWSLPTPRTLDHNTASLTGSWTSKKGGFSGTYSTTAAGSNATATWTTTVTNSDLGWRNGVVVSATWTAASGNSKSATYSVYDVTQQNSLVGTATVDQTKAPVGSVVGSSQFQELGDFFQTPGGTVEVGDVLKVVLNAKSSKTGAVVADAIGITPTWATTGGPSAYEAEPYYQWPFQTTGSRTVPDVSFNASDNSSPMIYVDGAFGNFFGTSVAAPSWAGLMAIVNQERAANGVPSLNTGDPTQALEAVYSVPSKDFDAVAAPTSSSYIGLSAPAGLNGYNEVTGRGTPIASSLVPDLTAYEDRLVITAQPPSSVTAGSTFALQVTVVAYIEAQNPFYEQLTDYTGNVTIALATSPTGSTLGGMLTVPVVNGIANFNNLSLTAAGQYTIEPAAGSLISATTTMITITPAAASQLVETSEPLSSVLDGAAFGLTITAEDPYGNVASSFSGSVTMSLPPGICPRGIGLSLGGTVTATVVNGLATFDDHVLSIIPLDAGGSYSLLSNIRRPGFRNDRADQGLLSAPNLNPGV